jgi:hypothetical protein
LLSQFSKLVCLASACVWFGQLMQLEIFAPSVRSTTGNNSRNEVVLLCTIVFVMLASLAASKQHNENYPIETHSIVVMWTIFLTVGCCIMVVAICCRPFKLRTQFSRRFCSGLTHLYLQGQFYFNSSSAISKQ